MPANAPEQVYSRAAVRRLLGVTENQLRSWEKQSLIQRSDSFSFPDLIALRTLTQLRRSRVPVGRIRLALAALREKLAGVDDPLRELKITSDGKKVAVQFAGNTMEPISGQLLFDFNATELNRLLSFPEKAAVSSRTAADFTREREAERWFEKGLELEQTGAPVDAIIEAYQKALEFDPTSAGALVNLGTVYFHMGSLQEAGIYYGKTLEVDPRSALAHFNLANLCDEMGDPSEALLHYLAALRLNPTYADAHYNIALLFQSNGQVLKAMRHWKAYLKLDPGSCWGTIARRELEKLRKTTVVRGSGGDRRESSLPS